jgi:hypothetical protein
MMMMMMIIIIITHIYLQDYMYVFLLLASSFYNKLVRNCKKYNP